MSQVGDKSQLALASEAHDQLEVIQEEGGFADLQDAYRLAVAVALAEKLEPTSAGGTRKTYLNIGSLDPGGELRNAVLTVRNDHDGRPVAFMERLAEAGIARIHEHLVTKGRSIRELLDPYKPASSAEAASAD